MGSWHWCCWVRVKSVLFAASAELQHGGFQGWAAISGALGRPSLTAWFLPVVCNQSVLVVVEQMKLSGDFPPWALCSKEWVFSVRYCFGLERVAVYSILMYPWLWETQALMEFQPLHPHSGGLELFSAVVVFFQVFIVSSSEELSILVTSKVLTVQCTTPLL